MSFTGNEDHSITLTEAAALTENYRNASSSGATLGHFFGKTAISDILAQEDCVGIRIYYGLDDNDVKQLVVVGVDEDENDLYNGLLAERSYLCPSICGASNALNS